MKQRYNDLGTFQRFWNATLGLPQQVLYRAMRIAQGERGLLTQEGLLDWSLIPGLSMLSDRHRDVSPEEMWGRSGPNQLLGEILTDPLTYLSGSLTAWGRGGLYGAKAINASAKAAPVIKASLKGKSVNAATDFLAGVVKKGEVVDEAGNAVKLGRREVAKLGKTTDDFTAFAKREGIGDDLLDDVIENQGEMTASLNPLGLVPRRFHPKWMRSKADKGYLPLPRQGNWRDLLVKPFRSTLSAPLTVPSKALEGMSWVANSFGASSSTAVGEWLKVAASGVRAPVDFMSSFVKGGSRWHLSLVASKIFNSDLVNPVQDDFIRYMEGKAAMTPTKVSDKGDINDLVAYWERVTAEGASKGKQANMDLALDTPGLSLDVLIGVSGTRSKGLKMLQEAAMLSGEAREQVIEQAAKHITNEDILELAKQFQGLSTGDSLLTHEGLGYVAQRTAVDPEWKKAVTDPSKAGVTKMSALEAGASFRRKVNKVITGGATGLREVDDVVRADRAASHANSRHLQATAKRVGILYDALANALGVDSQDISDRFSFYAQVAGGKEDFISMEQLLLSGDISNSNRMVTEMGEYLDRLTGGALLFEHESGWKKQVFGAFEEAGFARKAEDTAGPLFQDAAKEVEFADNHLAIGSIKGSLEEIKRHIDDSFVSSSGGRGWKSPSGEQVYHDNFEGGPALWGRIKGEVQSVARQQGILHDQMVAPIFEEARRAGAGAIVDELMDINANLSVTHRQLAEEAGLVGDVSIFGYMPGTLSSSASELYGRLEGDLQKNPGLGHILTQVRAKHRRPTKFRTITRAEANDLIEGLSGHDEGGEFVDKILDIIREEDPRLLASEVTDPFVARIVSTSKLIRGQEISDIIDNVTTKGERKFVSGELVGWMEDMNMSSIETVGLGDPMTKAEFGRLADEVRTAQKSRLHPSPTSYPAPGIGDTTARMRARLMEEVGVKEVKITTKRGKGNYSSFNDGVVNINIDSTASKTWFDRMPKRLKAIEVGSATNPIYAKFLKAAFKPGVDQKEVWKHYETYANEYLSSVTGQFTKKKAEEAKRVLVQGLYDVSMSRVTGGDLKGFHEFLKENGGAKKFHEIVAWHEVGHVLNRGKRAPNDRPSFLSGSPTGQEKVEEMVSNLVDQFKADPALRGKDKKSVLNFLSHAKARALIEGDATEAGNIAAGAGWKIPTNPHKVVRDTIDLPRRIALIRDNRTGKLVKIPLAVTGKDMTMLSAGIGPTPSQAFTRTHLRGNASSEAGVHHFLEPTMSSEDMVSHFRARKAESERLRKLGHDPTDARIQVIAGENRHVSSLLENVRQMERQAGTELHLFDSVHRLMKMGLTSTQFAFHVHNTLGAAPMLYANGANLPAISRGLMTTIRLIGKNPVGYDEKARLIDKLLPGTQMGIIHSGLTGSQAKRTLLGSAAGAGLGAWQAEDDQGIMGAALGGLTGGSIGARPKTAGLGAALGYSLAGADSPEFMAGGALSGALLGRRGLAPFREAKLNAERRVFADTVIQVGDIQLTQKEYWETFLHGGGFNTMVGEGVDDIRRETKVLRDMIMEGEGGSEKFMDVLGEFGQQSEIFARVWGYNTGLAMGFSPENSMKKYVLGTFFDYGDLSPTSQNVMKRLNSFWTFGSKIMSNTYDNFTKNPARFSTGLHSMLALDRGMEVGDSQVSTDFVYGRPHAHWNELSVNLGRLIPATEGLQAIGMFYDMLPVLDSPGKLPDEIRSVSAGRKIEAPGFLQLNVMLNPVSTSIDKGIMNGLVEGLEQTAIIQRIAKDTARYSGFEELGNNLEDDQSYEDFVSAGFFGAFKAAGGKMLEAEKRIEYLRRLQLRNEFAFRRAAERDPTPENTNALNVELKHMRSHFQREITKLKKHQ